MNQAFWNDPAVRRRGINLGVYRGVPFYTCPDPDCVWSAVDPTLKNPAVHFLAARSKYSPAGAEKIPIAPDALAVAKKFIAAASHKNYCPAPAERRLGEVPGKRKTIR